MSPHSLIARYTHHQHSVITSRGDTAITAALQLLPENSLLLIPQEGGWLSYKTLPQKLGLQVKEVNCHNATLDLIDLEKKLQEKPAALLYHQPGGYALPHNHKQIYDLCQQHNCLVIMDVCGSVGTSLCDGRYADICVGSFRKWKLVYAGVGGFISSNQQSNLLHALALDDQAALEKIAHHLTILPQRLGHIKKEKQELITQLSDFELIGTDAITPGLFIIYKNTKQKENIIKLLKEKELEYTQCPRYIRLNKEAISVELKRKQWEQ